MVKLLNIEFPEAIDEDKVVVIGGDLYVKDKQTLDLLLPQITKEGYSLKDTRKDNDRLQRGVSPETMEKEGWYLWYAHLENIQRGKCGSCKALIAVNGIRAHAHRCEKCNAVTYADIKDGTFLRFHFYNLDGSYPSGMGDIEARAKRWDYRDGYLYVYAKSVQAGRYMKPEMLESYLEAHKSQWEKVRKWGHELYRISYDRHPSEKSGRPSAISMESVQGHYYNHSIVKVWKDKEYSEWGSNFPLKESFHIFETWHWAPLKSSPTLHRRVLSSIYNTDDKGWHHQDGSPWFKENSFKEMGKFIRHFTTLDADLWDKASKVFRKDGPGGIDDVALFCHPQPDVKDRPNIGNLINGMAKAVRGERLSSRERFTMEHAIADRDVRRDYFELIQASHQRVS